MKYTIALSGTFDVENYGDLLFPEIFKKANTRSSVNFELVLFSPDASQEEKALDASITVYPNSQMEEMHRQRPFDAIVVGGGALLQYRKIPVKKPNNQSFSEYRISDSWVLPTIFALRHNIKILYNLPQVPHPFDSRVAQFTKSILSQVDYLGVRDYISRDHILSLYGETELKPNIEVYPDSVCCLPELVDLEMLNQLRSKILNFDSPYVVLHFNAQKPEKDDVYIVNTIHMLMDRGFKVVLLPLGYTHNDDTVFEAFNEKVGGVCYTFQRKLSIYEMMAILAGCEIYIGTSFHGAITALTYGRKAISYNYILPYKNRELFKMFGIESYVLPNAEKMEQVVALLLSMPDQKTELKKVIEQVNVHFDKIFQKIVNASPVSHQVPDFQDLLLDLIPDAVKSFDEQKDLEKQLIVIRNNEQLKLRKLETEKAKCKALWEERQKLQHELQILSTSYNAISRSQYWRITKPFRSLMDLGKRTIRRYPLVYYSCKGAKMLLTHGPKRTFQAMQQTRHLLGKSKKYHKISTAQRRQEENISFKHNIKFSIVVPLYNTPLPFLKEMIESVQAQTYKNWELCLADGSDSSHVMVQQCVKEYMQSDSRIRYKKLKQNMGISGNTNECLRMTTGEYIGLFDHDDVLHPSVLFENAKVIDECGADFLYTDEATFEGNDITKIITFHFKPDFAIDNLRANNYICHFTVFAKTLLTKAGMFRPEYDGSQDHDMILRLTACASKIYHIRKLLYFWRSHPNSVALDINSKRYAVDAGKRAVHDSIVASGYQCVVESSRAFPTIYRIHYELKTMPLVSIIIPNKNHLEDLERCLNSIFYLSTYDSYEIIILENNSTDLAVSAYYESLKQRENVRVIGYQGEFNYSAINNLGADNANGEYLLLLNNDTEVISPSWIEEMLMYAQREDVGAVGAKLYYPDNTIQHAGIVLGMGADRIAGHSHYRIPKENLGYMGRLCYAQDVSAVTGACLLVKKSKYQEVGGLDPQFAVAYNDIDLCLKLRARGYLNVFTPHAELYHYESQSRGLDSEKKNKGRFEKEVRLFKEKWGKSVLEKGDPYFNPNFSLDYSDFKLK